MTSFISRLSKLSKLKLINSIILFIWWFIFNPGFYSIDSIGILSMARQGPLTSAGTAIWAIFVKVLTVNGAHPEFATLFFSQLLAFSIATFAHTFLKSKRVFWSSTLICATPLVGAMGITLWHDIPMASGFLMAAVGFQKLKAKEAYGYLFLSAGLIFSSFRYNGLPTLLITLIVLIFLRQDRKVIVSAIFILLVVGGVTSGLNSKYNPAIPTQSDGFINWMRYDLSCYAANSKNTLFFEKEFDGRSTLQDWSSKEACTWFNKSSVFQHNSSFVDERTPSAWMKLFTLDPVFILATHLQRNAYLNPIPIYGLPSMPFIHTTIEKADVGIEFLNPSLTESTRFYPRIWNYFNFVFGYSGLWLLIIFLMAFWKKSSAYLGLGLLGLVLSSGLFIFAIIPDGRFTLFILIVGQLLALDLVLNRIPSKARIRFLLLSSWRRKFL
jgi:hypothetical protein